MQSPHRYTFIEKVEIESPRGRNDASWITHTSYAKESIYTKETPSPYMLPNEWIAGSLAQYLRLPVPSFCMMQQGPRQPLLFTSLQFTPDKTPPPDATPHLCWKSNPELCTGIALFDIFVGNPDRRFDHIAVDDPAAPKEIIPYDHDDAIAGSMYGDARKHFKKEFDNFLAEDHCLIPVIDSDSHFLTWIVRIENVPDWFITSICMEARTKGFKDPEANAAAVFLSWRSRNFRDILKRHKHKFTSISKWRIIL